MARFKPSLIDLNEYQAKLRDWKRRGIVLLPPPPIPGLLLGDWTQKELDAMHSNREAAERIYQYEKNRQI